MPYNRRFSETVLRAKEDREHEKSGVRRRMLRTSGVRSDRKKYPADEEEEEGEEDEEEEAAEGAVPGLRHRPRERKRRRWNEKEEDEDEDADDDDDVFDYRGAATNESFASVSLF